MISCPNSVFDLNFRWRFASRPNGDTDFRHGYQQFRERVFRYRFRGGKLYELALQHGLSPNQLSATLSGARRCKYDPRVIAIGETLGLRPDEVFAADDDTEQVAS